METCELTILMPNLNEAETLATCIKKARRFLDSEKIQGEILIADNGSTDGSQAIATACGARLVSVATKGYGAALKAGIKAAQGKFIIMGDADDSYDFLHLTPFVAKLREGYDLVMGNRFRGGIQAGAMPFLNRYLGNPVLSYFGRIFYRSNIGDFHCGLRGFQRERFLGLDLQGDGMEFASEMIIKASLNEYRMAEVPTQLFPDGRSRRPHLRPWRDGWRHLRLLLLFSPRWLFFYPGMALFGLGLLLMTLLCMGPLSIGGVTFDIHTMLFGGMFMISGWQAISFSIFAKMITAQEIKNDALRHKQKNRYRFFTLERGLIVGSLFLLLGLIGALYGVLDWENHAFGVLDPTRMMRLLIPSVTAFILGIQFMFASFFMNILGLQGYHRGTMGQSSTF